MATTSTNLITALNAGSGVDIKALAQSLVDAEKAPRAQRIQAKIDQSEAKISGFGAVNYALKTLKTAFDGLRDVSDFASVKASNSQTSALSVSTTATADTGSYDIEVSQIATAQRGWIAASTQGVNPVGFNSSSVALNGGSSFNLSLSVNGASASTIAVTTDTPAGIVSAINAADLGVQAQLLNTGDNGYLIVLSGETGADNSFTLSASGGSMSMDVNDLQVAADASFSINGLDLTRSSNTVSDALDGVTLNLLSATSGAARVTLARDGTDLKTKVEALVSAYNDFSDTLDVLGNRDSEVETYGGALAGDSFLSTLRSQVRAMITDDSDTAGTTIKSFRDIGVSFDRYGQMTFDTDTFDEAIDGNYDEVLTMMTADTEAQSVYSVAPAGAAGAAYKALDEMLRSSGTIATRTTNAKADVTRNEKRMTELEDRMSRLLERYIEQFSVMDALVGTLNKTREGLTSTFEGMMAAYTKN